MIFSLRDCGQVGGVLLAAAAVVILALLIGTFGARAQRAADKIAPWALLAGLVLLGAAADAGRFDGLPHVGGKFDATLLVWARVVMIRALSGTVVLALALPMAWSACRWAGWSRRLAPGLLVLVPPGLGMLASSVRLQIALKALLAPGTDPEGRLALLRAAVQQSELLLAVGAAVGLVGGVTLTVSQLRRSLTESP